jgi:hypothetical protein
MPNVLSISLYPRYLHRRKHMEPVVIAAMKRILYDDGHIDMTEISAAEYARIVAPAKETPDAVHDNA